MLRGDSSSWDPLTTAFPPSPGSSRLYPYWLCSLRCPFSARANSAARLSDLSYTILGYSITYPTALIYHKSVFHSCIHVLSLPGCRSSSLNHETTLIHHEASCMILVRVLPLPLCRFRRQSRDYANVSLSSLHICMCPSPACLPLFTPQTLRRYRGLELHYLVLHGSIANPPAWRNISLWICCSSSHMHFIHSY